ncbi:Transcription initiation factor TFIID subunit 2 [Astathelohania contejeani]|uniref:Transcription initiation factor TFIID subunit 2 n=1 Tax=Astathelohania contejeani TaxID=164912 RepID=A0ABQ7I0Z9_9MICR|nr:Transcription initiation factor TFIID subunit 2 [Thelohania contejeani]
MENLTVNHQKNVYYLSPDKHIYYGYIETSIINHGSSTITYNVSALEIENVEILFMAEKKDLEFVIITPNEIIDEYQNNFDKGMWERIINKPTQLVINLPVDYNELTIRIKYHPSTNNTAVYYHHQIIPNDKHREIVAHNRMLESTMAHAIFPSVIGNIRRYSWELIYILDASDCSVISPGIFRGIRESGTATLHAYTLEDAHPGCINFCAGSYETHELIQGDDSKLAYVPINTKSIDLKEMGNDLNNLIRYLEYFIQKEYPSKQLRIALTRDESTPTMGEDTAILPLSLIPPSTSIDESFLVKRMYAQISVSQYIPVKLTTPEYTDQWLSTGLHEYLINHCLRYVLGTNDFLYSVHKSIEYIANHDIREQPLYSSKRNCYTGKFFVEKAWLVFQVLEHNLSRAFLQKIIMMALKKRMNTADFVGAVIDMTGKDLHRFFDTYVFKPGIVILHCRFEIEKKKNQVDVFIRQKGTSILRDANKYYTGTLLVRAHEIEGVFDHPFELIEEGAIGTFFYHTRTKRTKKKQDEDTMPLLWVRIDPACEFLGLIILDQPEIMSIEQLLNEKSVAGQLSALRTLHSTPNACTALERVIADNHCFYKIRIESLYALSRSINGDFFGFQRLIQYFVRKYCIQGSTLVRPCDFSSSFASYFIERHLILALSVASPETVKNFEGRDVQTKCIISAFLLNLLRYHDNTANPFNDGPLLGAAIEALTYPLCSKGMDISPFIREIERFKRLDLIFPSHGNRVTTACVYALARLGVYGLIRLDKDVLHGLTGPANFISVRVAAIEALLTNYYQEDLPFLLGLIQTEPRRMKIEILTRMSSLAGTKRFEFIDYLFMHRNKLFEYLKLYSGDYELSSLIIELIYYIEGAVRRDEEGIVEEHELSSDEGVKVKLKIKREDGIVRLKINPKLYKEIKNNKTVNKKNKEKSEIKLKINSKIKLKIQKKNHTNDIIISTNDITPTNDINELIINSLPHKKTINSFILKESKKHKFFDFEPLTLDDKNVNIEESLTFVLTFSKMNSVIYNSTKACYKVYESLVRKMIPFPEYVSLIKNPEAILSEMERIYALDSAIPFRFPVPYKEWGLDKYVDIVRHPVDLGTLIESIRNGGCRTWEYLYLEYKRIFLNCKRFNASGSDIYNSACILEGELRNVSLCEKVKTRDIICSIMKMVFPQYFKFFEFNTFGEVEEECKKIEEEYKRVYGTRSSEWKEFCELKTKFRKEFHKYFPGVLY